MYLCNFAGGGEGNATLKKRNRFKRFQTRVCKFEDLGWDVSKRNLEKLLCYVA